MKTRQSTTTLFVTLGFTALTGIRLPATVAVAADASRAQMGYVDVMAEGRSLFLFERTPNFVLANLVDSPRMPQGILNTFFAGDGVDPRRWHMVIEKTGDSQAVRTPPLDGPVSYKRGSMESIN